MYRIIPVAALALVMAVSVAAQDSTVRSNTKAAETTHVRGLRLIPQIW